MTYMMMVTGSSQWNPPSALYCGGVVLCRAVFCAAADVSTVQQDAAGAAAGQAPAAPPKLVSCVEAGGYEL